MAKIIETGNVITCPECDRNLSYEKDDVFFNKITSCGHRNYYNKCVMCPYCKNKVVVSGDAVFVESTDALITIIEGKEQRMLGKRG